MPAKPGDTAAVPTTKSKREPARATTRGKDRSQQDLIWKEVLEEFFDQFMAFFFLRYHHRIDWSRGYRSLDKEMVAISAEGGFGKQSADKLFEVFFKDGVGVLLLLHIEVQGYKEADFAKRMADYNTLIELRYNRPVLSFAILTDADKDFRPNSYRWQFEEHLKLFQYPLAKLLDYWPRWDELAQDPNPFALVVMAHLKTQRLKKRPIELKEAKIELIRLLFKRGYEREYVLKLLRVIDWLVKLPAALQAEFQAEVSRMEQEVKMPIPLSSWERDALKEGLREGMLSMSLTLLEQRLGQLEPELQQQLEQLSTAQLQKLGKQLLSLPDKPALTAWLQKNSKA